MQGFLIALAGQVVAMMLLTGILRWLVGKFGVPEPLSTVTGAVAGLGAATIIAGYGFANGGEPVFDRAFATYLPAAAIALLIGLLTPQKRKT